MIVEDLCAFCINLEIDLGHTECADAANLFIHQQVVSMEIPKFKMPGVHPQYKSIPPGVINLATKHERDGAVL